MSGRRVMFYVQHLLGIGHLARASRIARALIAAGFEVTLVTGGRPVPGFPGADIPNVALPGIAVPDGGFKGLVDDEGRASGRGVQGPPARPAAGGVPSPAPRYRDDRGLSLRSPAGAVRTAAADRRDRSRRCRDRCLSPRCATSCNARASPERDEETVRLVNAHFDRVLVHGDPAFAALGDSFPLADRIADRVVYTGLVCGAPPGAPDERFDVVVSAGGGAGGGRAGAGRGRGGGAAARDGVAGRVITGPNLPQEEFDGLAALAPARVSPDAVPHRLYRACCRSRGCRSRRRATTRWATCLQAGCRALLIPYSADGETEQGDRAARLERIGRARGACRRQALSPRRWPRRSSARLHSRSLAPRRASRQMALFAPRKS